MPDGRSGEVGSCVLCGMESCLEDVHFYWGDGGGVCKGGGREGGSGGGDNVLVWR